MDIYTRKSYWKWQLALVGMCIVGFTLWYTHRLASKLSERETQQAEQFAEALRSLGKSTLDSTQFNCDVELHRLVIQQNSTVPVVLLDDNWNILEYQNIGDNNIKEMDTSLVRQALDDMVSKWTDTIDVTAIPYFRQHLIYSHSNLLDWLKWYPYLQLLMITAFIMLGYMWFSAARKEQENRVWLGMAKETAHQLGTPLTAILGWVEALRSLNEGNPNNEEMLDELGKDVSRLELVADRFSKIGAVPELHAEMLFVALERNREYMQRRAPRKVKFIFPEQDELGLKVNINAPLFDWVVENLLRNAIDAMENGEGTITAVIYQEGKLACVDITDTGKGIPPNKWKTIFQPGYSTKTRGWGLGLSLSKRIVELYHGGKIYVKHSEPGKGSTFSIKMPVT